MADDDEKLPDYLDRMVYSFYGETQRGIGYLAKSPLHSAVIDYIEDESTGRPVPIDDAADHFLLRKFDEVRRELLGQPPMVPRRYGGVFPFNGEVRRFRGWYGYSREGSELGWQTSFHADSVSGEIGWQCFHGDPDWPCVECGHHPNDHYDDPRECAKCNCGNNSRF